MAGDSGRWAPRTSAGPRSVVNSVRQASLREHNLGLLLGLITTSTVPPSRADLAQATGLTRTTVSALVDQLIVGGLLTELPTLKSLKAGRPAAPLVPSTGTVAALGMEVNVDYIGVRVLDLAHRVIAERVVMRDYRHSDPVVALTDLAALYRETVAALPAPGLPLLGACLALPGLVDTGHGPLRLAPNLHWRDVDVLGILEKALPTDGVPVTLANEASLAARAEAEILHRAGIDAFFYLSGEVGIGGAIAGSGTAGAHGWSGEIGHTSVDPAGLPCSCGGSGCLEQYAGKDALLRQAGLGTDRSAADLLGLADSGNEAAVAAISMAASSLGVALSNAVNLLDVGTIVLGGIYAPLSARLIPGIRAELSRRVLWFNWAPTEVRRALVGDFAALTGGALSVLATLIDHPSAWLGRTAEVPAFQ